MESQVLVCCLRRGLDAPREEFTVVLDNSGSADAAVIAERVRRAVEALRIRHDGSPAGIVTLSIGIAHASTVDADARALVSRADAAL